MAGDEFLLLEDTICRQLLINVLVISLIPIFVRISNTTNFV